MTQAVLLLYCNLVCCNSNNGHACDFHWCYCPIGISSSLCNSERGSLIIFVMQTTVFFQGNVGPAAFWLLALLLTNPEALTEVKTEMETLVVSPLDTSVATPVFGKDSVYWQMLRDDFCQMRWKRTHWLWFMGLNQEIIHTSIIIISVKE